MWAASTRAALRTGRSFGRQCPLPRAQPVVGMRLDLRNARSRIPRTIACSATTGAILHCKIHSKPVRRPLAHAQRLAALAVVGEDGLDLGKEVQAFLRHLTLANASCLAADREGSCVLHFLIPIRPATESLRVQQSNSRRGGSTASEDC